MMYTAVNGTDTFIITLEKTEKKQISRSKTFRSGHRSIKC